MSELLIKCVIEFDRFLRIFRGPDGNGRNVLIFSMFSGFIGLCVGVKIYFFEAKIF